MYKNRDQEMSSEKLQCRQILCRDSLELLRPDMKTFLRLLSAVLSLQCATSQISMVESGPGTVKPSGTLDLTCKVTGASLTDSTNMHCVDWIRQPEGKGLEWLGRICYENTINYAQSVQGRLTLSRDTNKSEVYGKLTGVKPEESGTYYCAREYYGSGYYFDKWGPGTLVTVTSAAEQAPSLFPLISCGTSQESTVTIGCLAKDFLPEALTFSWNDKSNKSFTNGFKTYKSMLQTSGTYAASSQIQVTGESWKNHDPYYCAAKHSLNTKVITLENKAASKNSTPVVTMAAPVKEDLYMNNNGTIVCIMSNYYPNDIKVKWLKNHVETTLNTMTDKANANADGKFVLSSFMTISKKDWDEDTVFSCVVEHSASGFFETRNVSKSLACESSSATGVIQVDVLPPSFESIFLNKKAPLTCVISNMMSAEGLDVSWYELGSDIKLETILDNPVYKDGAFSIRATATVCADDWLTKTFECRVKHPDLSSPKKVTLAKDNGQEPQTPTVLLYPPHQDELNRKESVTLTCVAQHFYPADILIKWTSSDQVEDRYVVTTKPMLEPYSSGKKSYFVYSTLTIPSIDIWNSGKSYTCVVGHESLPLQATQRSVDKSSGKPTSVNVSLVMSDSC